MNSGLMDDIILSPGCKDYLVRRWGVQCTVYSVMCTVYSLQCTTNINTFYGGILLFTACNSQNQTFFVVKKDIFCVQF